ncbi:fork head domain-containing protein [Spinellus fusiger]|nr:fork head domain-containing protein [Spinellus fusiger]
MSPSLKGVHKDNTPTCDTLDTLFSKNVYYLPPTSGANLHSHMTNPEKKYRSQEQKGQLQHHIISDSFIPMTPSHAKLPRKRRRPPFSYSSLIAQAILQSKEERMALRDIYKWIIEKYPSLYNAQDTGWQNTIRHNLSLNKCFRKIPKAETESVGQGKGGYWTIDPNYMEKFKNGAFARGSASSMRKKLSQESTEASALGTLKKSIFITKIPEGNDAGSLPAFVGSSSVFTKSSLYTRLPSVDICSPQIDLKPPYASQQVSYLSALEPNPFNETPIHADLHTPPTTSLSPVPHIMQIHNLLN